MNFLTTPVMYGLGAAVVVVGIFAGVQTVRLSGEQAAHSKTKADNAEVLRDLAVVTAKTATAVRTRETEVGQLLASSNTAREEGISRAVQEQQRVVAGVRNESIQLRKQWQGCRAATASVPGNAPAVGGTEEEAELRATGSGDLVRVGDDADVNVNGLIDYALACHALTQPINVR